MSELSDAEYLRERYGSRGGGKRGYVLVAAILILVAAIWYTWQAFALGRPTATAEPVAMRVVSTSELEVTFNLHGPIGDTVTCTARAYTEAGTEVGVREVTEGPLTAESSAVTVMIPTLQEANGATVDGCYIHQK